MPSQPCAVRNTRWPSVSTPSAITEMPSARPIDMIERTMLASSESSGRPRTNDLSIFRKSTDDRLRYASDEQLVPKSSIVYATPSAFSRSEEHTSELQSLAYLVCRLLLEK